MSCIHLALGPVYSRQLSKMTNSQQVVNYNIQIRRPNRSRWRFFSTQDQGSSLPHHCPTDTVHVQASQRLESNAFMSTVVDSFQPRSLWRIVLLVYIQASEVLKITRSSSCFSITTCVNCSFHNQGQWSGVNLCQIFRYLGTSRKRLCDETRYFCSSFMRVFFRQARVEQEL